MYFIMYKIDVNYNEEFNFSKDIIASEYFLQLRDLFCSKMDKHFDNLKYPDVKKRIRIYHNMWSQWFFWESYNKEFIKFPLLIPGPYKYDTIKEHLKDYGRNLVDIDEKIDIFLKELDLENKIKNYRELLENEEYIVSVKFNNKYVNEINMKIKCQYNEYDIKFPSDTYKKFKKYIGKEKTIALIFRYYALSSNNNQLAVAPKTMNKINADVELFASGFNNYFKKFCSIFPDLERELGSIGRFQDMDIISGTYQINPPFQTFIIYNIINKIKQWIDDANEKKNKLVFFLIVPNWDKPSDREYEEYQVINLLKKINGKIAFCSRSNTEFPYYDYWKKTTRDTTLPDSYFIKIESKN